MLDFLENDREVRDISMYINPLYYTDTEYYNEDSFSGVPSLIIHLAKNEIYARHGYILKVEKLFYGTIMVYSICKSRGI